MQYYVDLFIWKQQETAYFSLYSDCITEEHEMPSKILFY